MVLEILDHHGNVCEVFETIDGVAVPQNEAAAFLVNSMCEGDGVQLEERSYLPEDGDDFLRAVAAHLDGCYSRPRLRER